MWLLFILATHKKVVEGGAILITLFSLKFDHYPCHKAGASPVVLLTEVESLTAASTIVVPHLLLKSFALTGSNISSRFFTQEHSNMFRSVLAELGNIARS